MLWKKKNDAHSSKPFPKKILLLAVPKKKKTLEEVVDDIEEALKRLKVNYQKLKKGKQYDCSDPMTGALFAVVISTDALDTTREVNFKTQSTGADPSVMQGIFNSLSEQFKPK